MHESRGEVFNEVKHNSGAQIEIFQGRGGFVELGHFNKHFVKNTRKNVRVLQNQGTPVDFQKRLFEHSPPPRHPLVARLQF